MCCDKAQCGDRECVLPDCLKRKGENRDILGSLADLSMRFFSTFSLWYLCVCDFQNMFGGMADMLIVPWANSTRATAQDVRYERWSPLISFRNQEVSNSARPWACAVVASGSHLLSALVLSGYLAICARFFLLTPSVSSSFIGDHKCFLHPYFLFVVPPWGFHVIVFCSFRTALDCFLMGFLRLG